MALPYGPNAALLAGLPKKLTAVQPGSIDFASSGQCKPCHLPQIYRYEHIPPDGADCVVAGGVKASRAGATGAGWMIDEHPEKIFGRAPGSESSNRIAMGTSAAVCRFARRFDTSMSS